MFLWIFYRQATYSLENYLQKQEKYKKYNTKEEGKKGKQNKNLTESNEKLLDLNFNDFA